MKSSGIQMSYSRADLSERLASVMQASRAIRSEVALTICESGEVRLASRQLRMDSLQTTRRSAVSRQVFRVGKTQRARRVAYAIADLLSGRGYSAFVASHPQDTASAQ